MKPDSSPALTYFPVYLGLYLSLTLAAISNDFVSQMKVNGFGMLAILWAVSFALCLFVGWRQRGEVTSGGRLAQRIAIGIALLLLLFFWRVWDFPRLGVFMLLLLQAAQCCVCVNRRQLYLGLLVSLVTVLFASANFLADWTLWFYLLPYTVAVVFTLVAEQINRRSQEIRQGSLGTGVARGQGAAIAFATAMILGLGGLLYALTPQPSWGQLYWSHGQPGKPGDTPALDGLPARPETAGGTADAPSGSSGLTIAQMREAARRPGMPDWQAGAIEALADGAELAGKTLQPLGEALGEVFSELLRQFKLHWRSILLALLLATLLAMLIAWWKLLREVRPVLWLWVRLDYVRLVLLARASDARAGHAAFCRLFDLHGLEVPASANAREYLACVREQFRHLDEDAAVFIELFETARYGSRPLSADERLQLVECYRRLYRRADILDALDA
ncbi:MAG TPA: DUF4129 domain-containing protein [Pseudomonas sp.]|nr:DUF4129 domain-containing protein [Pseudomonas sp.]